jgi:hypothetical protein
LADTIWRKNCGKGEEKNGGNPKEKFVEDDK